VTVEPPEQDVARETAERINRDGGVAYDLTVAPTAQALGLPVDRDDGFFDRDSSDYWEVSVVLPGGSTFTTSRAYGTAVRIPSPPSGLRNLVGVNARARDVDDLETVLGAAVDTLGLDVREVALYVQDVRRKPPATGGDPGKTVLTGKDFGYLTTSVSVRPTAGDKEIAVNYSFTWPSAKTLPVPASPFVPSR